MVEGGLPGQTGAIFHFRPYPPISGGGKGLTPFPPYLYLGTGRTCEAQTEACMALPGRPIWLPVVAPMIPTN